MPPHSSILLYCLSEDGDDPPPCVLYYPIYYEIKWTIRVLKNRVFLFYSYRRPREIRLYYTATYHTIFSRWTYFSNALFFSFFICGTFKGSVHKNLFASQPLPSPFHRAVPAVREICTVKKPGVSLCVAVCVLCVCHRRGAGWPLSPPSPHGNILVKQVDI